MSDSNPQSLTSSTRLAKNTTWSVLGQILPMVAGVITVPILISGLGTERMGILSLTWMIVGYFNLFDLGIGRALTLLVAKKIGTNQSQDVPALIWTAMGLMLVMGLAGMGLLLGFSQWLVYNILNIPAELQVETVNSIRLLSLSVPVVIIIAGLRGVLEAYQRFDLVNYVRIPGSLFTFLAPVVVLPYSQSIFVIVAALVAGRLVVLAVHFVFCKRLVPEFFRGFGFNRELTGPLMKVGGWMLVSNLVGPLMVYLDRFIIGAVATMTAVTYYTTPYDVVTKFSVVPIALVGVLFPAFSMLLSHDENKSMKVFASGLTLIILIMFPVTFLVLTFAPEILQVWLGLEFSSNSSLVLQVLAVGVFLNAQARVPLVLIQGAGRPDLTAKIHLLELPFYIGLVFFMVNHYGINGAAIAWTIRMFFDLIALFVTAWKLYPNVKPAMRRMSISTLTFFIVSMGAVLLTGVWLKSAYWLGVMVILGIIAWQKVIGPNEKQFLDRIFRRLEE